MNYKSKQNYFYGIETLQDLRRKYYELAKIHHPDTGGDEATMKKINNDYESYTAFLIGNDEGFSDFQKSYETQVSEEFQEQINKCLKLENLTVEIIGGWLWVSGNTYPVKEQLKKLSFKFSRNKTAWYWHATNYKKFNNKHFSLDDIRSLWGSEAVNKPNSKLGKYLK